MNYKIIPINNWHFKFIAPFYLKKDFEYETKVLEWNFYLKRYVYKKAHAYLYSNLNGEGELSEYWFGWGWSPYILHHYEKHLDTESKEILKTFIDPIQYQFNGLRKTQQEDLNDLLKFRRGIFQVYTGYGKTQIIAHLVNYIINVRKERLLLLAPNSKVLNEIDNRVSELFKITHNYFNYNSDYNAININGFPRSALFDKDNSYWNTVKWIIAEEAEYVTSESGIEVIELCKNAMRLYAFSATADKLSGERIRMRDGNIPVVQRNCKLINYFGFTSVFKKPKDFVIHIKEIVTTLFNNVADNYDPNSEYTEIIYATFTDKKFCNGLLKIIQKESPLYIPMGRLEVIDYWIKKLF
jgi:superfamily II DNA or RNA helicase